MNKKENIQKEKQLFLKELITNKQIVDRIHTHFMEMSHDSHEISIFLTLKIQERESEAQSGDWWGGGEASPLLAFP